MLIVLIISSNDLNMTRIQSALVAVLCCKRITFIACLILAVTKSCFNFNKFSKIPRYFAFNAADAGVVEFEFDPILKLFELPNDNNDRSMFVGMLSFASTCGEDEDVLAIVTC